LAEGVFDFAELELDEGGVEVAAGVVFGEGFAGVFAAAFGDEPSERCE